MVGSKREQFVSCRERLCIFLVGSNREPCVALCERWSLIVGSNKEPCVALRERCVCPLS